MDTVLTEKKFTQPNELYFKAYNHPIGSAHRALPVQNPPSPTIDNPKLVKTLPILLLGFEKAMPSDGPSDSSFFCKPPAAVTIWRQNWTAKRKKSDINTFFESEPVFPYKKTSFIDSA